MAITDDRAQHTTITAVLTVRVPDASGADLATDTRRRLDRVAGIETVTVDGLRGLEPQMSATLVTVAVTLECTVSVTTLHERLGDAVAVEGIEQSSIRE